MTPMDDRPAFTPLEIVGLMRVSTAAAAAEVRALGDRAGVRPAPGEWCANEVLGHLLEADRRGFTGRVREALAEDHPFFREWDQPAVAAGRHDAERDPESLVRELLAQREADFELVAGLDATDLARGGTHPTVGELTVENLLHEWVHHDREHLAQLMAVTKVLTWPAMGNARRFSDPTA